MKDLFEFIQAAILTRVPEIKTCKLWNNQTTRVMLTKDEDPFAFPAVFVEFITEEVQSFCLGIKNVSLTVRFRFAIEGYKFERLENLDFCDTFDAAVTGLRGNEADPVQFSTMTESSEQMDTDHDQVNEPTIDYRTTWRKVSAYKRAGWNEDFIGVDIIPQPYPD